MHGSRFGVNSPRASSVPDVRVRVRRGAVQVPGIAPSPPPTPLSRLRARGELLRETASLKNSLLPLAACPPRRWAGYPAVGGHMQVAPSVLLRPGNVLADLDHVSCLIAGHLRSRGVPQAKDSHDSIHATKLHPLGIPESVPCAHCRAGGVSGCSCFRLCRLAAR